MSCPLIIRYLFRVSMIIISFGLGFTSIFAGSKFSYQESDSVNEFLIVRDVIISGNKITRNNIIQRELIFRENDTLPASDLHSMLAESQRNVFNTNLFNFVTVAAIYQSGTRLIDISVKVVERWYIWPIPFLEIADRNFNVWLESRDLSRLTYGVDFTFYNLRGRNETLKILTHLGYNQLYGFTYKAPYINRQQTLGIKFGFDFELNHEVAAFTRNNKPVFIKNNQDYLQRKWVAFGDLLIRRDFYNTNNISFEYSQYQFSEQVDSIPGFLYSSSAPQKFFSLTWFFKNDRRDVQFYPLNGYYLDVEVRHTIPYAVARNSYFKGNFRIYKKLLNRWFFAAGISGKLTFAKQQPYFMQRGLGYGRDFVRGYEYYVVDGQHYALLKSNMKFALVPPRIERIGFLRSMKFNTIPWALYLNAFTDAGFVYKYSDSEDDGYSSGNTLENQFLIGFGIGLDLATYYDIVIRLESAINGLGQPGVYLHFMAPI
ncbi:MAG: POTRA domain-containing protein [Bacteroidota bacterium]